MLVTHSHLKKIRWLTLKMSHKSSYSWLLAIISCHLDYLKITIVIGNFQLLPQIGILLLIK